MAIDATAAPADAIVRLNPSQLPELRALLEANGLPADDCAEQAENFYGIVERGRLIAAGGLQPAAQYFLLRSLVVAESCRGRGLARALTEFLLARAAAAGSPAVYLLTENAADYFAGLGFEDLARERVPAAIRQTRQFSSLCPDDARCLVIGPCRG
ncbi:MAG TPA: arsenic resistance N-acetyltransferase ArsN2 [Gammaproteobacteria bacterium]|jgi:N-acetylglutamate synthase-like GNAT family acetyltransferase